jgi:hypothetical protein
MLDIYNLKKVKYVATIFLYALVIGRHQSALMPPKLCHVLRGTVDQDICHIRWDGG